MLRQLSLFTVCSASAASHVLCSTAPFWAISVRIRIAPSVPIDFHTKIFFFLTAGTAMQSLWVPGGLALGMARYTYQYRLVLRQIPNGSDHPYPTGVGTLE